MQEQNKWNEKYRNTCTPGEPAELLHNFMQLLKGGKALDVASGTGSNSVFLARHGFSVDAVDISSVAINLLSRFAENNRLAITAIEADLRNYHIQENTYDVIVNFYYLERRIIPQLKQGLKKEGLIFFETYTEEQRSFGGISNPDYLLRPNELLFSFLDFFIVFYHERIDAQLQHKKAIASLIAQKV
jgi:2-polyprenyl-3-methyl-5-hydroxy-6-metoxy-1,4-benzoquinol methylase